MDATLEQFHTLGKVHGADIAATVVKIIERGHEQAAADEFMRHRMQSIADDLRAEGATETEVQVWARAAHAIYADAMKAIDGLLEARRRAHGLAAMRPAGHA